MEKRRPVDELDQIFQWKIIKNPPAGEYGLRNVAALPVDWSASHTRFLNAEKRLRIGLAEMALAQCFLLFLDLLHKGRLEIGIDQRSNDADSARGVEHVHDRLLVTGRDLHRSVSLAGGRAT